VSEGAFDEFRPGSRVLWIDHDDKIDWLGTVTALRTSMKAVVVKLDSGGTFTVPIAELRLAGQGADNE